MTAELGSRSDLEALRRSGRGKVLAVVVLMLAAIAAAGWSFLRDEGIGEPEDPTKVLVVSRGTTVGYSAFLKDLGFDAAEGTLAAWERKAHAEIDDLDQEGVAAVMTLADKFGYAYVAFESPSDVDFTEIDLDRASGFEPSVRFAVLSAGDLAFPHRVTVNPEPSPVIRDVGMSLLQALFEQPALAQTLPENDSPEISTIQLRDRLRDALDRLARIPAAEEMAKKALAEVRSALVDEERATPAPSIVTEEMESATPIPLPSGSVLTMGRRFAIVTSDAVRADLSLDDAERFFYGDVEAEPDTRKVCTSLAGGEMSVDDSARYAFSADGAAILIKNLSEGMVLWTATRESTPGSCAFERVGGVPEPAPGIGPLGVPHRDGLLARNGVIDGAGVIEVVTVSTGESLLLGLLPGVELGTPVWIDGSTLAAVGQRADGPDAVYVLHADQTLRVLTLDGSVFEGATELAQLAAVPGGTALVVTAGSFPRKLYRLDAPAAWSSLFESPPRAALEPSIDGEQEPVEVDGQEQDPSVPTSIALDPNAFSAVPLTFSGQAFDPVVSPDGRWVAMGLRDRELDRPDVSFDDEIALAPVRSGAAARLRLLTRNALRDHSPRFTADGRWVVFETRVEMPRTDWAVTAARRARVDADAGAAPTP